MPGVVIRHRGWDVTATTGIARNRLKTIAKTWGEWEKREITPEQRAAYPIAEHCCATFVNNRYHVQCYEVPTPIGAVVQAVIGRHGDLGAITWDELQRIKNELFGDVATGIEFYPAESRLVNQANLRHLWILPEGFDLPFGLHLPTAFGKQESVPMNTLDNHPRSAAAGGH